MSASLSDSTPRRDRPYTPYRRRFGEWPALLVAAMALSLWLVLPGAIPHNARPRRLPEAGSAYVTVDWSESPLAMRPDRFAHPGGDGFRRETELPPMPTPAVPAIAAAPAYRSPRLAPSADSVDLPPPPPPLPPLLAAPPSPLPARAPTNRPPFRLWLSPALRLARFTFPPADGVVTQAPGSARFHVALDAGGRVSDVLLEEGADPDATRRWRTALARGSGLSNALGRVELEWGP